MFTVRCVECGSREGSGVTVSKTDQQHRESNPDATISSDIKTVFRCDTCDITEEVNTGILPAKDTDHFSSEKDSTGPDMVVTIDGSPISYESIDEKVTESAYYNPEGVRGTSKIHHVHVHARNPRTISKGKHHLEVGEYIDQEMVLSDVRYHDQNSRTLKFFRSLSDKIMEPLDKQNQVADNAPAQQ